MSLNIAIIDYGVGNLRNVQKAFEHIGVSATVTSEVQALRLADGLVLPGVGAFGDGMDSLHAMGLVEPLRQEARTGKPLLGICLGLQLLFEKSEEMGQHEGLGLLAGDVVRFGDELKVPHIGWNQLDAVSGQASSPLLRDIADHSYAYFVHSFHAVPADRSCVLTTTDYGIDFVSIVGQGNVYGAQFHPEKSQNTGLKLLRNYARIVESGGT